jgi:hypothetical protein
MCMRDSSTYTQVVSVLHVTPMWQIKASVHLSSSVLCTVHVSLALRTCNSAGSRCNNIELGVTLAAACLLTSLTGR